MLELQKDNDDQVFQGDFCRGWISKRSRENFINICYQHATSYAVGKIVSNAGCGASYGCDLLATVGKKVIGIDYSQEAIDYAKKHYSRSNLKFKMMNLLALDFNDNTFDLNNLL